MTNYYPTRKHPPVAMDIMGDVWVAWDGRMVKWSQVVIAQEQWRDFRGNEPTSNRTETALFVEGIGCHSPVVMVGHYSLAQFIEALDSLEGEEEEGDDDA